MHQLHLRHKLESRLFDPGEDHEEGPIHSLALMSLSDGMAEYIPASQHASGIDLEVLVVSFVMLNDCASNGRRDEGGNRDDGEDGAGPHADLPHVGDLCNHGGKQGDEGTAAETEEGGEGDDGGMAGAGNPKGESDDG